MSLPRYPRYKDSGVEWLGQVPEHWEVKPLKRIVAVPITDGPHETPQFIEEGIPFVSAEAVSSGRIDFSKVRACISPEDNARYALKYSPKRHDIYMVKSGATTGITAIVEGRTDFNIWSPLAAIRCGESAAPYFVLNFMRSRNFLEAVTLGWSFGTQQNIGMGVIENLFCTLPPLAEQLAIARFLDRETAKIDALIAEQERLIELLKEKRQAVISHAVNRGLDPNVPMKDSGIEWLGQVPEHWEVCPMKRLIHSIESGTSVNAIDQQADTDQPAVLKTSCVYTGRFRPDENKVVVTEETHRVSCPLRLGTLIVSRMNTPELVGAAGYVVDERPNVFLPDRLWQVTFLSSEVAFIHYWTLTQTYRGQVKCACAGTSSSMQNLAQDQFGAFVLVVPPAPEQLLIISFLDRETAKLDALTTEAERAIELLSERRTALISAAVTGQIDVRNLA